jgi:transposase
MTQHKRGKARTQLSLLPASIEDYVQSYALVRVIDAYVDTLDMAGLGFAKSRPAATGRPSYAPQALLGLYLYGYWNGVRSSRRLEAECKRNLELMWLMGELSPDHKTIAEFRRLNDAALRQGCEQFVQFLREVQLVGGELPMVAVDGSKFKANASKKSLVDAEQVAKEREKTRRRIEQYLQQLDETDAAEEQEAELSKERIERALEKLRERDRKLEQAQSQLAEQSQDGGTARVGLTDPDCVLLKQGAHEALAGYNVQQAVDTAHHLIVAHEVTTQANDQRALQPMAGQAQQVLNAQAMVVVADTGYMNGEQAQACEDQGISPVVPMQRPSNTVDGTLFAKTRFVYDPQTDTYLCPAGQRLKRFARSKPKRTDYYTSAACVSCPLKNQCTRGKRRKIARSWYAAAAERAHHRSRARPQLMRLRSASVEHPFGNLKAMLHGTFLVRTLQRVRGEMALAVLTYNLKRALTILGIEGLMQKVRASAVLNGA